MRSTVVHPAPAARQNPGVVWLVYGLALVKFVLPFLLQHPVYEPHRDEFLYLAEGRHPAWGYLGAPPLLSVLAWISNGFGAGFFWIKFWPALFGAMTYVLVGRLILLLGGGRFAVILGFLPFVFGVFLRIHFLLSPDFLAVYFETLMVYGLVRYYRKGRIAGLYLTGIGFGLGVLSHYSVLVFTAWLVLALLLTPERKVLKNSHFYMAFLIGLLLLVPNLLWQAVHDWPVLSGSGRNGNARTAFLRDLLLFNLPGLFIWGAGLYRVLLLGREFRFVGWTALGMLGSLVWIGQRAEDAMGIYPVLFAFGAVTVAGHGRWRVALTGFALLVGGVLDTVVLPMMPPPVLSVYYSRVPVFRRLGMLHWGDGKDHALPQVFADMLGWEEMTLKAARVYESLDSLDKTGVLLNGGGSCGEAAALDYYGPKYSLPPVMGCRANYVLWTPAAYYDRDVFIMTTRDRGEMKRFASAVLVDSVTHPFSTECGSYIILLRGPDAAMRQEWKRSYRAMHREQLAVR